LTERSFTGLSVVVSVSNTVSEVEPQFQGKTTTPHTPNSRLGRTAMGLTQICSIKLQILLAHKYFKTSNKKNNLSILLYKTDRELTSEPSKGPV